MGFEELTGSEHGLSRTTRSSERWTISIGFERTGVSCLQGVKGFETCEWKVALSKYSILRI